MMPRSTAFFPVAAPAPARHLPLAALEAGLAELRSPRNVGPVVLVVANPGPALRSTPVRSRLTVDAGLEGDRWLDRTQPDPAAQLTLMEWRVARLIANGQPLTLFGDNLFLDLDLSRENLPPGSRLRVGEAVLEVTAKPHNGCARFRERFGADALRLVARPKSRDGNLRGIYARVVEDGMVAPGNAAEVLARPDGYGKIPRLS